LAGREQQTERAIRLLGAAEAFCETLGAQPPVAMREEYERTVAEGRATLGEAAFTAVWTEGRAMSLDQAIEYALEGWQTAPPGGPGGTVKPAPGFQPGKATASPPHPRRDG